MLAYLVGIHARVIQPTLAPLVIIAALPFAAALVAWRGLRTRYCSRRRNWAVLGISVVELVSAGLALATIAALAPRHHRQPQPTTAVTAFRPGPPARR